MNEITRGKEAEYLLNHEIIREAFDTTRQGIINAMSASPFGDEKTHNHLVIALQLLNKVERNIKTVAETGKLAAIQFEREESLLKRGLRKVMG